jgi:hypothetical protein
LKKLVFFSLAVVLILTLAMTASATTFNPYCGGRLVWSYINSDATDALEDNPVTLNHGGIKLLLRESISDEATGTWANIGAKIDGWPNDTTCNSDTTTTFVDGDGNTVTIKTADGNSLGVHSIYDFGWKKIGGSNFNIWYSSWESETTNIGQGRIYNVYPTQFNEDNVFDRDANHCITIDYLSDNLVLSAIYEPNKTESIDENRSYFAATYKFEGGDVHAGYYKGDTSYDDVSYKSTEYILGGAAKFGPVSAKLDYLNTDMDKDIDGAKSAWDGGNITQANISFDDLKFDVTLINDDNYYFKNDGGKGYQVRYSGFCDGKLSLVYKAMVADKDVDATGTQGDLESGDFSTAYIGYKYGIFETRIGCGSHGKDDGKDDYVFASVYASFW